jgi:hypothetical protein
LREFRLGLGHRVMLVSGILGGVMVEKGSHGLVFYTREETAGQCILAGSGRPSTRIAAL